MKKLSLCMAVTAMAFMFSCSEDETPIAADFTMTVSGQSPNAKVTLTNNTTGAATYEWTFSEGADKTTASEQTPGILTVDKKGTFEVTLVASNGSDSKTIKKTIEITGENGIAVFTDVAFSNTAGSSTFGRFFSTKTGKIYKDSEVNSTNGADIDLAFARIHSSVNYFTSPDDSDENFNIPNASTTKVVNYTPSYGITATTFDAATNDAFLNFSLTASDGNSFGTSHPYIILFQNKAGYKGAIRTKAVNTDRLLVDIKVQKYK